MKSRILVLAVSALILGLLRWNIAIGVRRTDADLRASVNRVIEDLLAEGRIKAIFDRYGLPFFPPFADR